MKRCLTLMSLAFCSISLSSIVQAQTPGYSFSSALISNDTYLSLGFVFTSNSSVTVSALGYFDYWFTDEGLTSGLHSSHTVGIFNSSGTLLTSTTVDAGNADPLIGDFRYKQITPIMLTTGDTYTLAATTNAYQDPWAYGALLPGFSVNPAITIGNDASRYWYDGDNILRDPYTPYYATIYAGPNFLLGACNSSVPEPGSHALLAGLGISAAGLLLRRRRTC